jgi:2-polyprenyl-6-methoxyphenol hydroxylase-like FAD-dependent oxidoreductase
MPQHANSADVVIVGGGIAGSALALVLARQGLEVTVLEQQTEYHDRVRGEVLVPWGVAEAEELGILAALRDAGGLYGRRSISYDEVLPPDGAEATAVDRARFLPGVPGPWCAGHPATCQALSTAAEKAGARYVRGAAQALVTPGRPPRVRYVLNGAAHDLQSRLVVGADGRSSMVRSQLGIPLHRADPRCVIAGLLVDDVQHGHRTRTPLARRVRRSLSFRRATGAPDCIRVFCPVSATAMPVRLALPAFSTTSAA